MRPRRAFLAWAVPAGLIVIISVGLTMRQASSANAPERTRFSGSRVVHAMPSLLASPRLPARTQIAVVRDAAAADYYNSPATFDTIIDAWRLALEATGADVRIVPSNALQRAANARVLVVPASPCLTIATRELIERAGERGQGLIVTGTPGTHDAGCRRIGYGLLVGLTGASRAESLGQRSMVNVIVPGHSPLALDIPPAARIAVHPGRQIALRGVSRDAFFGDYDLRPDPVSGEPLLDAAVTRSEYRGARVVYFGFELHDVVERPWNLDVTTLLVRNAVAWAGGIPLVTIDPWPNGRHAAAIVAQDVEHRFENAAHAADSLEAIGIPGSYFLATRLARYHRGLSRRLARTGEVGSHTVDHDLLGGMASQEQHEQLHATQADLVSLVGRPAAGLRPPEEQFDRSTMEQWLAVGGTYLLGANDQRSASPELLPLGPDTLVLIPRAGIDDVALMHPAVPPAEYMEARFLAERSRLRELGGLFVLSYHSQFLARRQHVPVLARVARTLADDTTTWIASGSDVARWWKSRARLQREVTLRDDSLILRVANPGAAPANGIVLHAILPAGRTVADAGAPLLPSESGTVRVLVSSLPPGTTRIVGLRLQ